tara:strand:- start:1986 stop:2273 length:288 start_codon:yes stop_codon:yes gene_type:complete
MKKITSLTEKDEIALNLLTRQIAKASECRISNMGGMCRTDREATAEIVIKWMQIYDYGVEQTDFNLAELEQWAKDNNEELDIDDGQEPYYLGKCV